MGFLLVALLTSAAVFVLLHPLVQVIMFALLSPRSSGEHHLANFTSWLICIVFSVGIAVLLLMLFSDQLERALRL